MAGRDRSVASRKGGTSMATDLKKSKRRAFRPTTEPELTWEIARLFPAQGEWSEEEYFALDNNHRVEYSDGFLEFLPMPTIFHQLMLQVIGDIVGLRVRLGPNATDRRQPEAGKLLYEPLADQNRRLIPILQSSEDLERVVIAECRIVGHKPEQTLEHPLGYLFRVSPVSARENQVGPKLGSRAVD
jgi:hypothetical protein